MKGTELKRELGLFSAISVVVGTKVQIYQFLT